VGILGISFQVLPTYTTKAIGYKLRV
jgi:hypothetical protein